MSFSRCLVAAGLAAALAGCGGEDGLDRSALAEQANEICTRYAEDAEGLGQPDLADPKLAEQYFSDAEALARRQQEELVALEPVEALTTDYDRLTAATERATVLLSDLAEAARADDPERRDELTNQLPDLSNEVDTAAEAVGASDCAG